MALKPPPFSGHWVLSSIGDAGNAFAKNLFISDDYFLRTLLNYLKFHENVYTMTFYDWRTLQYLKFHLHETHTEPKDGATF